MCPNERWFSSKGGDAFHTLFHFHLQWVLISSCTSPPGLTSWGWNVCYFITVLLECHLQAHVWPHTCLSLAESETRVEPYLLTSAWVSPWVTVWLWLGHFRTLVKWQRCSQVMMVMETGVITHTNVNEHTQSWMGFFCFFPLVLLVSVPIYSLFESLKKKSLSPSIVATKIYSFLLSYFNAGTENIHISLRRPHIQPYFKQNTQFCQIF